MGIRQRELVQHDEKQHKPRVGIRQRELVHDEKQHTPRVGIRQRESWFNMMKNNIRPEWASDRESWFNMMKNNIHPEWASDRERAGST